MSGQKGRRENDDARLRLTTVYHVIATIGHGAFSRVLRAERRADKLQVAIKMFKNTRDAFVTYDRELIAFNAMCQPQGGTIHVISMIDCHKAKRHAWLILELVYKLKEVPSDVLKNLKMKRQDVGIDLIAIEDDKYIAIQCKYRKTFKALSWRDVATFDALCMRTGPWHKCIIITTSHNIKREGVTLDKDIFWGKKHFSNLSK